MASYVESTLIGNETVIYKGHITYWSILPHIIWGLIFMAASNLMAFCIGLFIISWGLVRIWTTEVTLTNKRIVIKTGLIRRDVIEMEIRRVESLNIKQGIFGRIFKFGSVVLYGAGNQQAVAKGVANAMAFRRQFYNVRDQSSTQNSGIGSNGTV